MQFFFFFFSKIFEKNLKKPKNCPQGARGRGRGQIFFLPKFLLFFLGAHAKIWNPTTTPSVVLNTGGKKISRQRTHFARTKICKIVATFVYSSSQGQRTHSARTNLLHTSSSSSSSSSSSMDPVTYRALGCARAKKHCLQIIISAFNFTFRYTSLLWLL